MTERPAPDEVAPYFQRYIALVPDGSLVNTLRQQGASTAAWARGLSPDRTDHAYAEGKWTLGQVLQHVLDTERIFATRALRIARGDDTPLPGFEQDDFVAAAGPSRPLAELAGEGERLRATTVDLMTSLDSDALRRIGTSSGGPLSARAAGWIIAGHELHHRQILRERYAS